MQYPLPLQEWGRCQPWFPNRHPHLSEVQHFFIDSNTLFLWINKLLTVGGFLLISSNVKIPMPTQCVWNSAHLGWWLGFIIHVLDIFHIFPALLTMTGELSTKITNGKNHGFPLHMIFGYLGWVAPLGSLGSLGGGYILTLAASPRLDRDHVAFGRLCKGGPPRSGGYYPLAMTNIAMGNGPCIEVYPLKMDENGDFPWLC